jgi:hypothetical protein
MSRKTILLTAPLGLGALVLLWAAMAARGDQEAKPARPERKAPAAAKVAPAAAAPAPVEAPTSTSAPLPPGPAFTGEFPAIESRIRLMEEKLLGLESKRDALLASNQDMERQIGEKHAEANARQQAEWRVRQWEQMLGLSENQKQALMDLWTAWVKADGGRPQSRETWQARESELRSRLTVEQAGKLHDTAATQSQQMWNYLGRTIAGMVGAPKEDYTRFQQTLGDWRAPNQMLLPEGHGADWPSLLKEGTGRLQPMLSSDQLARLNRYSSGNK